MMRQTGVALAMLLSTGPVFAEAPSGPPVTIGFSMPLTGGLAVNGTSGLLAMQIWAEDTNKKGGLLGRPVRLVYYDDQTDPSLVPGIYTKLLDVDKVEKGEWKRPRVLTIPIPGHRRHQCR
jgi:branched-chain amino acid transport system substrate-binding protein